MRLVLGALALLCAAPAFADDAPELAQAQKELRSLGSFQRASEPAGKKGPYLRLPNWEMAALLNSGALASPQTKLTEPEKKWAREIFADAVDLEAVRVSFAPSPTGYPMTWGNVIRAVPGQAFDRSTVIHELVHVWQYQTSGMGYLSDSFLKQSCAFITHRDSDYAYHYVLIAGQSFLAYSAEQQAQIVEDFAVSPDKQKDERYKSLLAELRAHRAPAVFSEADAAVMMEKDAGLPPRGQQPLALPGWETPFNGEAAKIPQFELRF